MFGIEELTRSFQRHTSGFIVSAVIAAGFMAIALLGNYTYFGTSSGVLHTRDAWLLVPLCGVVGGLSGGVFSRVVIGAAGGLRGRVGQWLNARPVAFAMLCGLGVALCGAGSDGTVYGTGYDQVKAALEADMPLPAQFGVLKLAATLLTSISTIPGGIFSPSLAIGAGIGANIGALFGNVDIGVLMLLGMAAYLAGVVQAPITSFIIVTEMTNNHSMLIPLMAAAVIGHGASRLVCPEGIYHALARRLLDGIAAEKKRAAEPAPQG